MSLHYTLEKNNYHHDYAGRLCETEGWWLWWGRNFVPSRMSLFRLRQLIKNVFEDMLRESAQNINHMGQSFTTSAHQMQVNIEETQLQWNDQLVHGFVMVIACWSSAVRVIAEHMSTKKCLNNPSGWPSTELCHVHTSACCSLWIGLHQRRWLDGCLGESNMQIEAFSRHRPCFPHFTKSHSVVQLVECIFPIFLFYVAQLWHFDDV